MLTWWQVALAVIVAMALGAALLALVLVLRSPRGWTRPTWRR
jgi:hypothetical protein